MWHAWERREKCTRFWWESPKRPLGRPRRRWEDGIRTDLREIGLGDCGLDSTGSGQGQAVVSAVMNLRVLAPRGFRRPSRVTGVVQTVRLTLIS
jgi:hypothetical protein